MRHSAIKPEVKGLRVQCYEAAKGRKKFEGRNAVARGSRVELNDSKGNVLTREDVGGHERACRIAREWCE